MSTYPGKDYVIRNGRRVWLAKYGRWNGSRWVSAEEQNAALLASLDDRIASSCETWTGADQIIEGVPS